MGESDFGAWLEPLVEHWGTPLTSEVAPAFELLQSSELPPLEPVLSSVQPFADPIQSGLEFGGQAAEAFLQEVEPDYWQEPDFP